MAGPRQQKTFKIEGWDGGITVYELTPHQIMDIFSNDALRSDDWGAVIAYLQTSVLPQCVSLAFDDLKEFGPSYLRKIYEQFQKVNSVFFECSRQMGLTDMLAQGKEELRETFGQHAVFLLRRAMLEQSIMDTASSSKLSKSISDSSLENSKTSPSPSESPPMQTKEDGNSSND